MTLIKHELNFKVNSADFAISTTWNSKIDSRLCFRRRRIGGDWQQSHEFTGTRSEQTRCGPWRWKGEPRCLSHVQHGVTQEGKVCASSEINQVGHTDRLCWINYSRFNCCYSNYTVLCQNIRNRSKTVEELLRK